MRNQRPKTFVTPGVLAYNQYGTTGRFGNGGGGGSGYPFTPTPFSQSVQSVVFSEIWGEYATGESSVVTAAKWTWSAVTNTTIATGLNQIAYLNSTLPTSFTANTAAQTFNASKGYSVEFDFSVSVGSASTNNLKWFAEDDGTGTVGFGVVIQADNLDGNVSATFIAANATVGVNTIVVPGTGIGDHLYRLAVAGPTKQMTLFVDNVQMMQATPPSNLPTGSKKLTLAYVQSGIGNHGAIGPMTFKAFKT